jgi:hypothetical protein
MDALASPGVNGASFWTSFYDADLMLSTSSPAAAGGALSPAAAGSLVIAAETLLASSRALQAAALLPFHSATNLAPVRAAWAQCAEAMAAVGAAMSPRGQKRALDTQAAAPAARAATSAAPAAPSASPAASSSVAALPAASGAGAADCACRCSSAAAASSRGVSSAASFATAAAASPPQPPLPPLALLPPAFAAAGLVPVQSLQSMLAAGLLTPGPAALSLSYRGRSFTAALTPGGGVVDTATGAEHATVSAWTLECKRTLEPGMQSDNGWKCARHGGRPLRALWDTYLAAVAAGGAGAPPAAGSLLRASAAAAAAASAGFAPPSAAAAPPCEAPSALPSPTPAAAAVAAAAVASSWAGSAPSPFPSAFEIPTQRTCHHVGCAAILSVSNASHEFKDDLPAHRACAAAHGPARCAACARMAKRAEARRPAAAASAASSSSSSSAAAARCSSGEESGMSTDDAGSVDTAPARPSPPKMARSASGSRRAPTSLRVTVATV